MHPESKHSPVSGLPAGVPGSAVSANSGVSPSATGGSSDNDGLDEDDEEMVNDHVSEAL